jgi:uncharacterized protein (DUF1800 family)
VRAHLHETNRLLAGKLAQLEFGESQLRQVMDDFWASHFYIPGVGHQRESFLSFHRSVIAPNSLGSFRELLMAVVRSPSMLHYLDNDQSVATPDRTTLTEPTILARGGRVGRVPGKYDAGLNENFARELLELHTLGADEGYTQADVIAVARAFTGWTHTRARNSTETMAESMLPRGAQTELESWHEPAQSSRRRARTSGPAASVTTRTRARPKSASCA